VSKRNKAAQDKQGMNKQRGGTLLGFILGALVGLGVALAVAVYITKVPMPFMTKTPPRAGDDAAAEAKKNRDWDPNAGLSSKPAAKASPADPDPAAAAVIPAPAAKADPIGDLAKAKTEAVAKPASTPAPAPVATAKPGPAPVAAATPAAPPATAPAATGSDPFNYFVQVGAFRTPEDAEQQRIKLSLMGLMARVSEREQSGRTVYRVRLGPFDKKDDADKAKEKIDSTGLEATLVRVQK
jgi:cell division septation protein DedD